MEQTSKSNFYYANRFSRIALQAYEEVMGKNGINVVLNRAGLNHLIDHYPPDNLQREFDFADFTAIHIALEEVYGPRGGRGLALRAGRIVFEQALKNFDVLAGIDALTFKVLPCQSKMRIVLPAMAQFFSQVSDQSSAVAETDTAFIWTIQRCPICWSRKGADKPVCYLYIGLLQSMLTWISSGLEFRVSESKCCAAGDEVCEFVVQKEPVS